MPINLSTINQMYGLTLTSFELNDFDSSVTIARKDAAGTEATQTVRCTWLIDASGRNCFIGRRLKLIDWNDEHPIASIWARWDGVRHIDDLAALDEADPQRKLARTVEAELARAEEDAFFWTGICQYEGGDFDAAASTFRDYLARYPRRPLAGATDIIELPISKIIH
mgnify:CR=1 FL=1